MSPLPGYEQDDMVWKLKKCLYGFKQSAREWYALFSRSLLRKGFEISNFDPCVFLHRNARIFISVYIDDIDAYAAPSTHLESLIAEMKHDFEITDQGTANWLLGLHITYTDEGITLSQRAYFEKVLKKFNMESSRPVSTPLNKNIQLRKGLPEQQIENPSYYQSIIGSLMYGVTGTRPDLAHTISLLSQFNSCPDETHLSAANHVLQYLNGTKDYTLFYPAGEPLTLEAFSDADYATCTITRRSYSGYIVRVGRSTVSWKSRKQDNITTSTTAAEYLALSLACRQLQWFLKAFADLKLSVPCALRCDNTATIAITENDKVNDRSKHIDVHYHKVREELAKGTFELLWVSTHDNLADICTKTLTKPIHEKLSAIIRCTQ